MVSNFSSKFVRRGGYSFDEATIVEMVRRSSQFADMDVDVEITFEDGQQITTSKVEDLFDDSYVKGSIIKQLVMRAWNTKQTPALKHVMVILRNEFSEAISVVLTADRQSSTTTRVELQNLIDGRRQWYSSLFPTAAWLSILQIIWLISVAIAGGILVSVWMPGQVSIALWVALVSVFTVGVLGIRLMDAMFPRVLFEFGRSERRVGNARMWRNTIGGGVMLALIVAIAGAIGGELIMRYFR